MKPYNTDLQVFLRAFLRLLLFFSPLFFFLSHKTKDAISNAAKRSVTTFADGGDGTLLLRVSASLYSGSRPKWLVRVPSAEELSAVTVNPVDLPVAMSFAVMRNTHEAFRSFMKQGSDLIKAGALAEFSGKFGEFEMVLSSHAIHEESGMFSYLDAVAAAVGHGAASTESFCQEHEREVDLRNAIRFASTVEEASSAFDTWAAFFESHLAHEEKVMMPLTQKLASTPSARSQAFAKHVLSHAEGQDKNFDQFIAWTVKQLSTYGSAGQSAPICTRVWVFGLQTAATAQQWKRWQSIIQASCTPEVFKDICANIDFYGIDDCLSASDSCECVVCSATTQ